MRARLRRILLGSRGPEVDLVWYDDSVPARPVIGVVDFDGLWMAAYISAAGGRPRAYPIANQRGATRT